LEAKKLYIIKRDGSITQFNKKKIINAINKAFIEVDGKLYEDDTAKDIAEDIERQINHFPDGSVGVEDLQDWIEDYLMRSERRDVARAYIRYRYKKEVARNKKDDFIKAIREKLDGNNVKNQNANVDEHSFGGRIGEASSVVTKQLALDYLLSPMARKNHIDNIVYTHDLDSYYVGSHNCLSIPFDDLLANGFNTRQADVRPAGSINTAFQLIAVIFQIQSLC
jgi:anaerobic ribonucleoside-triphosphate reductase